MAGRRISKIFARLSENAKVSLRTAVYIAKHMNGVAGSVGVSHLVVGVLLSEGSLAARVLNEMGVNASELISIIGFEGVSVADVPSLSMQKSFLLKLSSDTQQVISSAYQFASRYGHVYVGTEHLLLALLSMESLEVTKKLTVAGLNYRDYATTLARVASYPTGVLSSIEQDENVDESVFQRLGTDLVGLAENGALDPVVGRQKEIDQIINILSRRKKNNPIIIGEAGVGKTALVEGLAQRIVSGDVPSSLAHFRIVSIDITALIAGSKLRGEVEERMIALIEYVKRSSGIILFIDEIQTVLTSSMPMSGSDIASVLKVALTERSFRCIGATTNADYSKYFEENSALVRRFQPVRVEESSVDDTIEILKTWKSVLEEFHGVKVSDGLLRDVVRLSDRYVSDRYLPDKAIDLLDEAAAVKGLEVEKKYQGVVTLETRLKRVVVDKQLAVKVGKLEKASELKKVEQELKNKIAKLKVARDKSKSSFDNAVDLKTVKDIIASWTGIPVSTLSDQDTEMLLKLDKLIKKRVVGQDEAVESVVSAIKRARMGISSGDKPWASFLFLGPTGVGKSELAKVLTEVLFGDRGKLIQLDMSEMMEKHSVSKLIGSPPGYVGFRTGGQLTEAIKNNPHSVVLFDEIEKAHADVLNILLQILEDGHLTDGRGRKVDFKNTIVILTSNIGSEEIKKDTILGFTGQGSQGKEGSRESDTSEVDAAYEKMKSVLSCEARDQLRPELINRLDDVVIFRTLSQDNAKKIVGLLLDDLNARLQNSEGERVKVVLTEAVVEYLVGKGFDDMYGARALRRVMQSKVEDLVANWVLEHISSGGDTKRGRKVRSIRICKKRGDDKLYVKV